MEEIMTIKRISLLLILLVLTVSCKTKKKKTEPAKKKEDFPAILWKKSLSNKVFAFGESKRRVFNVILNEKNNPVGISALNKVTGRQRWSKEIEMGLFDKEDRFSFGGGIKSVAIAVWTSDNKILAVDKYRGVELWDKKVPGFGLSVLGVNFVTAWNNNIRIIDPESGKFTDYDIGRKITHPVHVTHKGYLAVITGDTLNLVDLQQDKVKVRWSWKMDMEEGFDIARVHSSDEGVVVLQRTVKNQEQLYIKGRCPKTFAAKWKHFQTGSEAKHWTFDMFSKGQKGRMIIKNEESREKKWLLFDYAKGKPLAKPLFKKENPSRHCFLTEKISYCTSSKGVTAYDTKTWKKKWFQETIFPVNREEHAVINGEIVLAAINRIKIFAPDGSSSLAYDLKHPRLKQPRVNTILGQKDGILYFTVVDLSDNKSIGEIWALDRKTKKLKWRRRIGKANSTLSSVLYVPEFDRIYYVDKTFLNYVDLANGRRRRLRHLVRTKDNKSIKIGKQAEHGYLLFSDTIKLFELKSGTMGIKLFLEKKASKKEKEEKYDFIGIGSNHIILKQKSSPGHLFAFDLEKGKKTWEIPFKSVMKPELLETKGGYLFHSYGAGSFVNKETGKEIKSIKNNTRTFKAGHMIVTVQKKTSNPPQASRLFFFKYEAAESNPKAVWKKEFKPEKDTLEGWPSYNPAWIKVSPDYVFYPVKGGRCLKIVSVFDGQETLNLCHGVWPWAPLLYKGVYYQATGPFQSKIPVEEQGLIQFKLNGKFSRILKLSKYGEKYMHQQLYKIQNGTIYLQGNKEVYEAVKVAK
jgi:outer membrane protein assembly factor BamB